MIFLNGFGVDFQALGKDPHYLQQHPEAIKSIAKSCVFQFILIVPQTYVFTVSYLRRELQTGTPEFSANNFFYWLGKAVQKFLLLLVPGLIMVSLLSVGVIFKLVILCIFFFLLSIPVLWFVFLLTYRLILVTPLAVLRQTPVFKTSWNLTRGNWWRLFGNFVVLSFVLFLTIYLPFLIVKYFLALFLDPASTFMSFILTLGQGVWQAVSGLAMVIFNCTTYRVLLRESSESKSLTA
jgi:hypothetical protein